MTSSGETGRGLLPEAMRDLTRRLQSSLGSSGPLKDSLTKGEMREEDVVRALRPHVADRYGLAKGIIVDSSGSQSDPQDVVIHDSYVLPTLIGSAQTKVFPVESVVGTVQVKSVATASNIRAAVSNVASAKRLLTSEPRYGLPHAGVHQPGLWMTTSSFFGGALFLSSRSHVENLIDAYNRANADVEPRLRCDALCIVGDATVLWGSPTRHGQDHLTFTLDPELAEAPLLLKAGEDCLLFFYLALVERLRNWITPPMSWLDYVFGPESARYPLHFDFSYWYPDENHPPDWAVADGNSAQVE